MRSVPSAGITPNPRHRLQDGISARPIRKRARHDRRRPGDSNSTGDTIERSMAVDPINQIPVELLSEIFLICAHTPDESERGELARKGISPERYRPIFAPNATPYTLSSVCTRWRSIGLSTPKLWSKFTIQNLDTILSSQLSGLEKYFMVALRKWLKRSKDHPLQFSFSCLNPDKGLRRKFLNTLFKHIHRWSIVYFENILAVPAFQRQLIRDLLKAEKLDTLEFRHCNTLSDDIPFLRLPRLRRLAIISNSLKVEEPGCLNVTHLALTHLKHGTYTFFEYLLQFPSLVSFEASILYLGDWLHLAPPTPITHTALTELIIEGYGFHRPLRTILANIHLPNIRRLCLTGINFHHVDEDMQSKLRDVINDFICRHESTFSDLEISGRSLSSSALIEILRMFPKHLVSCRFDLVDLADEVVQKLTLNPSNPSQDLAPNLSYLSLRVPNYHMNSTGTRLGGYPSGDLLTEMILSRWSRNPHIAFDLEVLCAGTNPLSDPRVAMRMQQGSRLLVVEPPTL